MSQNLISEIQVWILKISKVSCKVQYLEQQRSINRSGGGPLDHTEVLIRFLYYDCPQSLVQDPKKWVVKSYWWVAGFFPNTENSFPDFGDCWWKSMKLFLSHQIHQWSYLSCILSISSEGRVCGTVLMEDPGSRF